MHKVSKLLHFIIFADDTNIFYLDKDPNRLVKVINAELVKLTHWFKLNKLSLNVQKSNYMLFCNKKNHRFACCIRRIRVKTCEMY